MLLADLFDLSLRGRAEAVGLDYDGPGWPAGADVRRVADRARAGRGRAARGAGSPAIGVAVHLSNRLEFIDLFLACVQSGLVLVPINVLYREREIAHIVADAEPRLIVTTAAQRSCSRRAARS